jgi:hypothetical protein
MLRATLATSRAVSFLAQMTTKIDEKNRKIVNKSILLESCPKYLSIVRKKVFPFSLTRINGLFVNI